MILKPEFDWEGANLPISTSSVGGLTKQEHALRDPFLFEQSDEVYMVYTGGGENSIGIAKTLNLTPSYIWVRPTGALLS